MVGSSETATKLSKLGPIAETLSEQIRFCIERLLRAEYKLERSDLSSQPKEKLAAVLVLLYENAGELRVVLTTRSQFLRTHPGETALPGGRVDESDSSLVDTAVSTNRLQTLPHVFYLHIPRAYTWYRQFREAHEEPFLSAFKLVVTPVVALLTDVGLLGDLTPCVGEVDRIFSHPLEAILDPQLAANEPLVAKGTEHWPYSQDYHSMSDVVETDTNVVYRMHRFRSCASPIKGLTADILIHVAEVAYHKKTSFERHPLGHAGSASYFT